MSLADSMDSTVAQLERNYSSAYALAERTTFWPGFGFGDSVDSALYTARRSIDWLKGEGRAQVLAGTKALQVWNDVATSANANLRTLSSNIPALSLSGIATGALSNAADSAMVFGGLAAGTAAIVAGAALFLWLLVTVRR